MSYYFNLPALTSPPLTPEQRTAINLPEPIALSGGPGTGKSVVSLYRHIINLQKGKSCQLLTYTTTLALYLSECCRLSNEAAANNVSTTFSWINRLLDRSEIIIDEAQDVKYAYRKPDGFLTWKSQETIENNFPQINIYNDLLRERYNKISYGADNSQMVLNGTDENELRTIFNTNQLFRLSRNFRNTKKILRLAHEAFPNAHITYNDIESCVREGEFPVLHIASEEEQNNIIMEIIRELAGEAHNIAILCPWQNSVNHYYDIVKDEFPDCSYFISNNNHINRISNIHVTTFKSAKGLEFDTVIIPDFHLAFQTLAARFNISWKDFYVGVTRAKSNLYLIGENEIPQILKFVESNTQVTKQDEKNIYDDLPF
jgi:superfamily I DNA/RNA helicase